MSSKKKYCHACTAVKHHFHHYLLQGRRFCRAHSQRPTKPLPATQWMWSGCERFHSRRRTKRSCGPPISPFRLTPWNRVLKVRDSKWVQPFADGKHCLKHYRTLKGRIPKVRTRCNTAKAFCTIIPATAAKWLPGPTGATKCSQHNLQPRVERSSKTLQMVSIAQCAPWENSFP